MLAGYIFGLSNCSNGRGVLNLHFADDTLFFFKANAKMLEAFKLLLVGFAKSIWIEY